MWGAERRQFDPKKLIAVYEVYDVYVCLHLRGTTISSPHKLSPEPMVRAYAGGNNASNPPLRFSHTKDWKRHLRVSDISRLAGLGQV